MAVIWSGETKTAGTNSNVLALVAGAVLLATLLALLAAVKPAEAAFPGGLGAIAYTSGPFSNLDIYRIEPDGSTPTNLTSASTFTSTNENQPAWSSEGTFVAFVSNNNTQGTAGGADAEIWRIRANGTREAQLTDNTVLDLEPSWFPTDTRIAFRRNAASGPEAHIWVLRLDEDGNVEGEDQLTTGSSSNISPAVSPNGKQIAFASFRDGDYEIYVMKAKPEGRRNKPVKLTRNTNANPALAEDTNPDWSPDGRRITFQCTRGGNDPEICVMNSDGTKLKQLTNNTVADHDPAFSPDGKRITFERDLGGSNRDIWRMRTDGANAFNVTDDGTTRIDANPSWQPR